MTLLQDLKNVADGIFLSTKQSTMVWTSTKKVDNPVLFWGAIAITSIFTTALIYILLGVAL